MGYSPWGHKESDRTEHSRIHAMGSGEKNVKLKAPLVWNPYGERDECNGSSLGDGEDQTE